MIEIDENERGVMEGNWWTVEDVRELLEARSEVNATDDELWGLLKEAADMAKGWYDVSISVAIGVCVDRYLEDKEN